MAGVEPPSGRLRIDLAEAAAGMLSVAGELDIASAPQLRTALQQLIDTGVQRSVLTLTDLSFCDSTGPSVLVWAAQAFPDGLILHQPSQVLHGLLRTTVPGEESVESPDLIDRDFTAAAPGERLVGDITYLKTGEGWLYLATVIDLATRMVVGWQLADHMRTSLIIDALAMAADDRGVLGQRRRRKLLRRPEKRNVLPPNIC